MALLSIEVTLRLPPEIIAALAALLKKGDIIMNDLKALQDAMAALEAKVTETNATLTGLAQAVVDLKASGDVQAGIDALTTKAQTILDSLTAAEDAADDQLPTPPTP
jgi:uncharacterized coiled-coil protein SlyX